MKSRPNGSRRLAATGATLLLSLTVAPFPIAAAPLQPTGAAAARLTTPQLSAALLTADEASGATGFNGVLAVDAGNPACGSVHGRTFCTTSWSSSGAGAHPSAAGIWSARTRAKARSFLDAANNDPSSSLAYVTLFSATELVMVMTDSTSSLGIDSVTAWRVTGTNVAAGTCARSPGSPSVTGLVACARRLARAQAASLR